MFMLVFGRYERASLIATSNKPFIAWGEIFDDDATTADDRHTFSDDYSGCRRRIGGCRTRNDLGWRYQPGRPLVERIKTTDLDLKAWAKIHSDLDSRR